MAGILGSMQSGPQLPVSRRIAGNPVMLALGLLLVVHFLWLASYVVPGYASPDADGYFAQAGLIANQGRVTFEASSPAQYLGIHWLEKDDGAYISRYPPGLPLLLAASWKVFGRWSIFYVNPLLATLTVLAVFLLCRAHTGPWLALAAAAAYALNPLADFHAIHSDAHTAAAFFLAAGLWLLDSWIRNGGWTRALGSGLLLGYLPTVRYAEAVAGLGVLVWIALSRSKVRDRGRQLALLVAGAALPLVLLAFQNYRHFGAFWRTGYSLTNEQQITVGNLSANWHSYMAALLSVSGAGLFFALGVAGLAGMIARRETRAAGAGLAAVIVAITAVYSGYYFSGGPGGASVRFLLPTLPLFMLPSVWLFGELPQRGAKIAALGVVLAIHAAYSLPEARAQLAVERDGANRSAETLAWVEAHVPADSVVVAAEPVQQALNFAGRWRLADAGVALGGVRSSAGPGVTPGVGPGFRAVPGSGRPGIPPGPDAFGDQPNPMQAGKAERLRAVYAGLGPTERAAAVWRDLREWAGGTDVYWIGGAQEVDQFVNLVRQGGEGATAGSERVAGLELGVPERTLPAGPGGFGQGKRKGRGGRGGFGKGPPPGFGPGGFGRGRGLPRGAPPGGFPPPGPGGPGGPGMGPAGTLELYRLY